MPSALLLVVPLGVLVATAWLISISLLNRHDTQPDLDPPTMVIDRIGPQLQYIAQKRARQRTLVDRLTDYGRHHRRAGH